ncbi:hypothetical protein AgCh_001452 [Apium graveolens]
MARLQQTQRKRVGSAPRLPDDVVAAIAAELNFRFRLSFEGSYPGSYYLVSIMDTDEQSLFKVLGKQALEEAELKKGKKKCGVQKCTKLKVSHVEEIDSTSKPVDIIVAEINVTDVPSPSIKKQKTIMANTFEFTLEHASTNSITLVKSLCSSITYHANDSGKLSKMSSLSCEREIRALASHVYF